VTSRARTRNVDPLVLAVESGSREHQAVTGANGQLTSWRRYGWVAGIVFVVAVVVDIAIAVGIPINQNDSSVKIASELDKHSSSLIAIACVCVVYAAAFVVYIWTLHEHLRGDDEASRRLAVLVLTGGLLMVACHALSDVAITGLLGAKVASYSAANDPGLSYALYLLTFAISSLGDVFGSVFMVAAGGLTFRTGLLPRWLGYVAIVAGVGLFLQGFGLGGVIGNFGLAFDLVGFGLFLLFVAATSVSRLRRDRRPAASSVPAA
jgi:hypothetical protein